MVAAVIGVGAAVLGGALSFSGSKSAKKAARRAAAEQARQEKVVTEERIRQLYQEERSLSGRTRAISAGSGAVVGQGSILQILAEQASEFERERRITRSVGASRVKASLDQGKAIGDQAFYSGLGNLFQGIGSAVNLGYQSGLFTKKGP